MNMMAETRAAIEQGRFASYKKDFLAEYREGDKK
jgi:queuine/archaeosine tRNA-ribosyltransferase